jgi:hypothetical protein
MLPGLPALIALLAIEALNQLTDVPVTSEVVTDAIVRALEPEVEMYTVDGAVVLFTPVLK